MKSIMSRTSSLFGLALIALTLLCAPIASFAGVLVSVAIAPPALPVYTQPVAPGAGYLWTPGYWAYGSGGYFWVPGTWVIAPFTGALWTPGYWGWANDAYVWRAGYWGPRVGFYGGINYGFGYIGVGYRGGYWNNGVFSYNTAVNNVNVTNIHNTYNETIVNNATAATRVSYNGGAAGIAAQPTAEERVAERDQHRSATPMQAQHEQAASANRAQLASVNHGTPIIAATPRAAAVNDRSSIAAQGATTRSTAMSSATTGQNASHVVHPGKDARLEPGSLHPNSGAGHQVNMSQAQNQAHTAHNGGERRD